jgi:hypothetical protein
MPVHILSYAIRPAVICQSFTETNMTALEKVATGMAQSHKGGRDSRDCGFGEVDKA